MNPKSWKTWARRAAWVIGALLLAVAGFAIYEFTVPFSRGNPQHRLCSLQLQQIEGAKEQWALENKKQAGELVLITDVTPYLKGGIMPVCPDAGLYTIGKVGVRPRCTVAGHTL